MGHRLELLALARCRDHRCRLRLASESCPPRRRPRYCAQPTGGTGRAGSARAARALVCFEPHAARDRADAADDRVARTRWVARARARMDPRTAAPDTRAIADRLSWIAPDHLDVRPGHDRRTCADGAPAARADGRSRGG